MNSLVSYGSDDDYDDSSEEKQTDWRAAAAKGRGPSGRQTDANYEEVQMDLSEGSNDSKVEQPVRRSRERDSRDRRATESRDSRDSRESREGERKRERNRHERDRRSTSSKDNERLEKSSSHDYTHGKRDREREKDRDRERDRKAKRSSSKERRRSRSPRRPDRESGQHSRSRSRSRDRPRKYSKKFDKRSRSRGRDDKSEPQRSTEDDKKGSTSEGDRFFIPGITGRFRDQIERRKQLWQKKDTPEENKNGQGKKVWETTTFAQDFDGKVANKFKRLMGIKSSSEGSGQSTDVLRKQEEMFSSMEQQYEVARTATHTMRGVGLGFGSYQR